MLCLKILDGNFFCRNSIDKSYSLNQFGQMFRTGESSPFLFRTLAKFKSHTDDSRAGETISHFRGSKSYRRIKVDMT